MKVARISVEAEADIDLIAAIQPIPGGGVRQTATWQSWKTVLTSLQRIPLSAGTARGFYPVFAALKSASMSSSISRRPQGFLS